MNNKTFSDKVPLVTGGTSGIGKATAIEFARASAKVVLTGRRETEGAQVVAEIKKLGGDAAFVRADVAKDADVKGMVDFTVDKFGRLDVAFNNAGVEWMGPVDQATEAEYRRVFDINVWGVLNSMRHEIPAMLKTGGAIVNNAGVYGHVGMGQGSIITASKHAVEASPRLSPSSSPNKTSASMPSPRAPLQPRCSIALPESTARCSIPSNPLSLSGG
jgi:NADP-dependent 3-hydroxy acid dehydrogenase YdfG